VRFDPADGGMEAGRDHEDAHVGGILAERGGFVRACILLDADERR
jgi:hypothetical protein